MIHRDTFVLDFDLMTESDLYIMKMYPHTKNELSRSQGCSLGLERLGLETVSRRFLERLGLVSVLNI